MDHSAEKKKLTVIKNFYTRFTYTIISIYAQLNSHSL